MNNIINTFRYLENRRKYDEIAIAAIKKQIGMKVVRHADEHSVAHCHVCNNRMTEFASKVLCDNYCKNCGQALDWSEDK